MSMDLTLIVYESGDEKAILRDFHIDKYSEIYLTQNYKFFVCISSKHQIVNKQPKPIIEVKPLAVPLLYHDDEGLFETKEDPYGVPFTYCLAGEFRKLTTLKDGQMIFQNTEEIEEV